MFDWEDLKCFVAAARTKSFQSAGLYVGRDRWTVVRRVTRLESSLKATLFVRSAGRLELTATGSELMEIAVQAEAAMKAADQIGQSAVAAGTVRISASEGFGVSVLAPALPKLLEAKPGLRVELAALAGFLSASRREVDIAITLSPPVAHRLTVEPLAAYQLALFGSAEYLDRWGEPADVEALSTHRLVGYVDDLIYAPELRYLDELGPGLKPTVASASLMAQRAIIASGGGVGVLPCFLAEGLRQVMADAVLIERCFWLSINNEVQDTVRIRTVRSWLQALVAENADRLCPHPRPKA